MQIVKITKEYKEDFIAINQATVDNLPDKSFYIPFTEEETEAFFEGSKNVLYGIIDNGKLAAVSGLLFDLDDFTEEFNLLYIRPEEVGEIGGSMTLPDYRNKGYMSAINKELMRVALEMGLKYIVATAHPDNTASNKSLLKLGMKKIKEFCRHGTYLRNLYLMETDPSA